MNPQHHWYQTDSKIIISVMIRNVEEKKYNVAIECSKILITTENKIVLDLNLLHPILPAKSTFKTNARKIEVSLTKETCARWESLEKNVAEKLPGAPTKNWDNIAEAENEEEPHEETVGSVIRKIYMEGSLEVKLAMTKSYIESEGTVLSTNWEKVRRKKVEVQPRDG